MSLYKEWTDLVVNYVKTYGEKAFWDEYGTVEKKIYEHILSNKDTVLNSNVKALSDLFHTTNQFVVGFLDGINDSLKTPVDLENIEENTQVSLDIDFEKLYFNMLDAKADYLYSLKQWDSIISEEKRKEIKKDWSNSKIVRNDNKVGRNDPCPCGSGKKYKKCCGRNA
ncbi:MAG: SEC-C metal-binding domain-containing protein [Clostridiaceae bacterium]